MAAAKRKRATKRTVTLPSSADVFVGRRAELDALEQRLASGTRLLTLIGPPGTGKTRLSIQLAERLAARVETRMICFVDLTPANSGAELVHMVASAVGARLPTGLDDAASAARIGEHLAGRGRALIVLDNFEQLVEHAATVGAWLGRARELTVVVTSRERLRIAAEDSVEIAPLTVPEEGADAEAILASEAVRLMLARAPGLTPGADELEHFAAIARRLEGIPLALELAASRLSLLGIAELRQRLTLGLDVLGRARRDAPARQATLRAALDWSWALLSDEERRALGCLSLFRGPFGVEAAVATIARGTADASAALDALQSLRDKSLVARATQDGARLRLFESIREHARERRDDREAPLRLARHLAAHGARCLAELGTRKERAALAWIAAERENLFAAHDALAESAERDLSADVTIALRIDLLLTLDPVLARLGPGGAHLTRLDAALQSSSSDGEARAQTLVLDEPRRTRALVARARVRRDRGEMAECVADLTRARDLLRGVERSAVRAELGEAWLAQGRFDEALQELETALHEAREGDDRRTEQRAQAALGLVFHGRGQLERAEEKYAAALDLALTLGDAHAEAEARRDRGNLCLMRGEHDRARAHYEEALARAPGDDLRLEGLVRGNLAILDQEKGELDAALAHLKRALTCLRVVGDRPFEAHLTAYLGAVHHERGQLDTARDAYSRALDVLSEVGDARLEGLFLAARAAALAASGRCGQAWNDLEIAARRLADVGDPALIAALGAHRAQVALAAAGADANTMRAALDEARRARTQAQQYADTSDDVRFALRLLQRAIPAEQLSIGAASAWFQVPGCAVVTLSTRPTLARLLDALVDARLTRPGEPVDAETLFAAGWPGERAQPMSARNRLRVALTTLRNLGLRGVLIFRESGHFLDPAVTATRAETRTTAAG